MSTELKSGGQPVPATSGAEPINLTPEGATAETLGRSPVGVLAEALGGDAQTLIDVLSSLVGDGNPDGGKLDACIAVLSRMGMISDRLAVAHGCLPMHRSATAWLFPGPKTLEAFELLGGGAA